MVDSWVHYKPEQYLDYVYELPVQVLGWVLELQSIAIIILFGLVAILELYFYTIYVVLDRDCR